MSALGDERILFDVRLVFTSTKIKANSYCLMFVWRQWLHCDFVGDSTRWCGLCSWHRSGCTYGSPARPFLTIRETRTLRRRFIFIIHIYLFVLRAHCARTHRSRQLHIRMRIIALTYPLQSRFVLFSRSIFSWFFARCSHWCSMLPRAKTIVMSRL